MNSKLKAWSIFMALSLVAVIVGCSDVGFESVPLLNCDDNRDSDTKCITGAKTLTYSFSFRVGEVDILFVDDNSGSMYAEQQKMGNAFANFIGNISNLFYNIGIVTTDVSASPGNAAKRAANGNGAFQDGKLLEFKNAANAMSGLFVLTKDVANADELFRSTIKRNETLVCDQSGFAASSCPSSDERGVYALRLALERKEKNFFREGAHLAVVILSDEDERGASGTLPGYALEAKDDPSNLVEFMMNDKFLQTKSLSVHSITVAPGDSGCLNSQTQQSATGLWPTKGQYSYVYSALTNPSTELSAAGNIIPGIQGTICANDYSSQLANIGRGISDNTLNNPTQLNCNPKPEDIEITTSPAGYESVIQHHIDSRNVIYFSNVPIGTEVDFVYKCSRY